MSIVTIPDQQKLAYNIESNAVYNREYFKLEKKYAPALDNYGQSCFVRSDFFFKSM
jgi:hypothetical protein